jgi:hypothetical protein
MLSHSRDIAGNDTTPPVHLLPLTQPLQLLLQITATIADPAIRDIRYASSLLRDVSGYVGISRSDANVQPDAWNT